MEAIDVDNTVFSTGHQVFDQIFYLRRGMTVLVSDETFSEARSFLNVLLKKHGSSVVELVAARHTVLEPNQFPVPIEALQDLSIHVNQKRRTDKGKIFIHVYLPEVLIRHSSDEVLRVLEMWKKDIINSRNIEFYILPRNTFEDFERKARSIVDAAIDLQVVRQQDRFLYYFTPMRSCSPRHHLKNIRFEISNGRLFIEWEGALLESLPSKILQIHEIREKIETGQKEIVFRLNNLDIEKFSVGDYVLLTVLNGMKLSTIRVLYPDKWHEIVDKIVQWVSAGFLTVEESEPVKSYNKRSGLKFKSRLILKVPTRMAITMLSWFRGFLGEPIRTVPLEAHLAVLEAMKNIIDLLSEKNPETRGQAKLATKYFGEFSARKTALEYVIRLEGTPYTNFRLSDLPKLIEIAMKAGWGVDVKFLSKERESWLFEIEKCHLCNGISSDEPFCDKFISSVVSGVSGVCLKREVECVEITCRAMGSGKCRFRARLV